MLKFFKSKFIKSFSAVTLCTILSISNVSILNAKDNTNLNNIIEMPFSITDFKLGNEMLIPKYSNLIDGKKIGLVTNQTGVNSQGKSSINLLYNYDKAELKALYAPEHGIDGKAQAGKYVKSYIDKKLNIPVYSLYNDTRMPTEDMLSDIDVLVFDIQDIGARSYTYMSTLNYCMKAAEEYNKEVVVLDRPNPLGGVIFDGPVLEDKFKSFVGIDNLPFTHGMTPGELAKYFNRNIDCDLSVVPMTGYTRDMVFQDTGLEWVQTSPYIPTIEAAFCYNVSGLGDGTGLFQDDYFTWVGGKGLDSNKFARILNIAGLEGVEFIPEDKGKCGGVKINITDYHKFNPSKAGIYVLSYGKILLDFDVPKSEDYIILFDKIMGNDEIGKLLEENTPPEIIELTYDSDIGAFKKEREKYLIYK